MCCSPSSFSCFCCEEEEERHVDQACKVDATKARTFPPFMLAATSMLGISLLRLLSLCRNGRTSHPVGNEEEAEEEEEEEEERNVFDADSSSTRHAWADVPILMIIDAFPFSLLDAEEGVEEERTSAARVTAG